MYKLLIPLEHQESNSNFKYQCLEDNSVSVTDYAFVTEACDTRHDSMRHEDTIVAK